MSFHLNAKGNVGKCRAQKQCPFGSSNEHYATVEAARAAFEHKLGTPVAEPIKAVNPAKTKTVKIRAKIYRSGILQAPKERGVEKESYLAADRVKPEGRTGRTEAIFASPTIEGVTRWFRANSSISRIADPNVREITVDPDKVYVYSVRAWERASSYLESDETRKDYWNSGMTLTAWMKEKLDSKEWEILLKPEDILGKRNVGPKRLMDAVEDDYDKRQIERILYPRRRY